MSSQLGPGLSELTGRRRRSTPTPRHQKVSDVVPQLSAVPDAAPAQDKRPAPSSPAPTAQPAGHATPELQDPDAATEVASAATKPDGKAATSPKAAAALPPLPTIAIDPDDPDAFDIAATMLNMPSSIMDRFEEARKEAASHTAIVLDAIRGHAQNLPSLILARRPSAAGKAGDLFPWRETPGATRSERSKPLRIRPTVAELRVLDTLVEWCNEALRIQRAGGRRTNRSEMTAAALDAYLPKAKQAS